MPEGPSIIILKEAMQSFKGKAVVEATGNSKKIDFKILNGKKIIDLRTWGKHFLICFPDFTIKIHLLMFGSYRINERKDAIPRLSLRFARNKELNFYTCAVTLLEQPLDELYDWSADVMSGKWDAKGAREKLNALPHMLVCDALLNQEIFAGVGNIMKNEVLFRIKKRSARETMFLSKNNFWGKRTEEHFSVPSVRSSTHEDFCYTTTARYA
jgi:endonuclease-8